MCLLAPRMRLHRAAASWSRRQMVSLPTRRRCLHSSRPVAKQSPGVFGVPTMHYDGGSAAEARKPVERLYVKEVALSLLRHRLDSNGLARQQSISPDVSFARSSTSVPRRLPRLRAARELELATRKTVTC